MNAYSVCQSKLKQHQEPTRNFKIMQCKSLSELSKLPKEEVKKFVDSFDTVLTDCDGVLWHENSPIEGASKVLKCFREKGKKIFYITNNSTKVVEDFIRKANKLGFTCKENEMISASFLAAHYLQSRNIKKVYVIGSIGIEAELQKVGIGCIGIGPDVMPPGGLGEFLRTFDIDPEVGAVLIGFDEHVSYLKVLKASSYLGNPDCLFLATNTDENFPVNNKLIIPGTGTFVAAVSTCSGRTPVVLGKPNPLIVEALMEKENIVPEKTLMIGDRCNTDILLGKNCGFQTLLVLTGVTSFEAATKLKNSSDKADNNLVADFYLQKLGDMLPFLKD